MYKLDNASAIKRWQSKNFETLVMKTIIVKLDLLKKTVIIQ